MFTVCVRKPDGNETLYECIEVTKEPNALLMSGGGVGGVTGYEILGPGGGTMAPDWDRNGKATLLGQEQATIFVMNSHGKTIATYHL